VNHGRVTLFPARIIIWTLVLANTIHFVAAEDTLRLFGDFLWLLAVYFASCSDIRRPVRSRAFV
jgi:uncharacterized membrane protein